MCRCFGIPEEKQMKFPFFKSLVVAGALLCAWNCSNTSTDATELTLFADAWLFSADQDYLIYDDMHVTDAQGNHIGNIQMIEGTTTGVLFDLQGNVLVQSIDFSTLEKLTANTPLYTIQDVVYLYTNDDNDLLIYADGRTTDVNGNTVAQTDMTTGVITSIVDGSTIATVPDFSSLKLLFPGDFGTKSPNQQNPVDPNQNTEPATDPNQNQTTDPNQNQNSQPSASVYVISDVVYLFPNNGNDLLIYADGKTTDANGNVIAQTDMTTGVVTSIADGSIITTTPDFTLLQILFPGDPGTKSPNQQNPAVDPNQNQNQTQSSAATPTQKSSSSSAPKSSSSAKSSSSKAKSSSSAAQQANNNSKCPNIVKKGGSSGNGWATRYWDCCKPSCSWNENAGGHPAKQCSSNGKNQSTDYGAGSVCSGGPMATCTSQIPFTIDGCEQYGFAFAAVPASNGGQCGKCFQLTFTGEGKYGDCPNCKKLAEAKKKLIIMVTNIGGDVNQGQFDVMIPGGGVGAFNGCSAMGWGNQGEQYGGLLSNCETENNYKSAKYASCLTEKCNSVFGNDSEAKQGCLFLANWMLAASNPMHNYEEVECPDVLKQRY